MFDTVVRQYVTFGQSERLPMDQMNTPASVDNSHVCYESPTSEVLFGDFVAKPFLHGDDYHSAHDCQTPPIAATLSNRV